MTDPVDPKVAKFFRAGVQYVHSFEVTDVPREYIVEVGMGTSEDYATEYVAVPAHVELQWTPTADRTGVTTWQRNIPIAHPDPVDPQDTIAELRALRESATPGPWQADEWRELVSPATEYGHLVHCSSAGDAWFNRREDVDLIAAMHAALPALLDVAEAAIRVSDKRTLDTDGFWVSQREMRYLDNALAPLRATLHARPVPR